jgi:hypothetical protein
MLCSAVRSIARIATAAILLASCTPEAQHPITLTPPIQPGTATLVPTGVSPSPSPRSPATPAPPLSSQLSPTGPWLVMLAGNALYAMDADASSLVSLTQREFSPWEPDFAASPAGGLVALKSYRDGLTIVRVPQMEQTQLADLLPPEREYTPEEVALLYQAMEDTYAAVLYMPSIAWSHNGSMLAFVSAMNGASPDIYIYNAEDTSVNRLTSGPTFAMYPEWSPDDRYILHDAANAVLFGKSGRGHRIASVWVAPSDLSTPRLLFNSDFADQKGFERRLGWLSDSTYVAASEPEWCPPTDLRVVSIPSGSATPVWSGSFYDAAVDPATSTFLILVPRDGFAWTNEECAPSEAPGLYLLSFQDRTTLSLGVFDPGQRIYPTMQWSEQAQLFFLETDEGLIAVTLAGETIPVDSTHLGVPTVAPDGLVWAFPDVSGEGLWIGDLHQQPRRVFQGDVGAVTWAPDGSALFFIAQRDDNLDTSELYVARPPEFTPLALVEHLDVRPGPYSDPFEWVTP